MKYIGITILYYTKDNKGLLGILKSYTVSISDLSDIHLIAERLSKKEIEKFNPDYISLGLNDVFKVSSKADEKEIVGRTSYYEFDSIEKGANLIEDKRDYSAENISESGYFNCSLIYFYSDKEKNENYTIAILTILKSMQLNVAIEKANKVANDKSFKEKILVHSIEKISTKNLKYIGIEDICNIEDDIELTGAFQTFYSPPMSLESLKEELLSSEELSELVDESDL